MRTSLRERGLRRELALARGVDFPRERLEAFLQTGDGARERRPLLFDARDVLRRLRGLALERLAPSQRRRVVRLDARQVAAFALRLRAQLFELQLAAIDLRSHSRQLRSPSDAAFAAASPRSSSFFADSSRSDSHSARRDAPARR